MKTLAVAIPGPLPPSPNARMHWKALWRERQKAKKAALEHVQIAVEGNAWTAPPVVKLAITFVVPDLRARDWDNALASLKPWIDALVEGKAIAGDSHREIEHVELEFVYRHGLRRTVFTIEATATAPTLWE